MALLLELALALALAKPCARSFLLDLCLLADERVGHVRAACLVPRPDRGVASHVGPDRAFVGGVKVEHSLSPARHPVEHVGLHVWPHCRVERVDKALDLARASEAGGGGGGGGGGGAWGRGCVESGGLVKVRLVRVERPAVPQLDSYVQQEGERVVSSHCPAAVSHQQSHQQAQQKQAQR